MISLRICRSTIRSLLVQIVVIDEPLEQYFEGVALSREVFGDFRAEEFNIVIEVEGDVGEGNRRADLGAPIETLPIGNAMSQQSAERGRGDLPFGCNCHGMQADVKIASVHAIERVESANGIMAFKHADFLIEMALAEFPPPSRTCQAPMMIVSYMELDSIDPLGT